jgi:DNA-binding NtrC family response regulator
VLNLFNAYHWPGNIREVRNTLERAVIVCEGKVIDQRHLPPNFGSSGMKTASSDGEGIRLQVGTTVGDAEKALILKTLASTNNNKTRAAEILGISLKTLHNKLKEYGAGSGLANEAAS